MAKSTQKEKQKVAAKANSKLVALIKGSDKQMALAKSAIAAVAAFIQREELTKEEVVASYMDARGCTESTAISQYSRIQGLIKNPDVLKDLEDGKIDLKVAMAKVTNKQKNPSKEAKAKNLDKSFNTTLTKLVNIAKEAGLDFASFVLACKAAGKKAGL